MNTSHSEFLRNLPGWDLNDTGGYEPTSLEVLVYCRAPETFDKLRIISFHSPFLPTLHSNRAGLLWIKSCVHKIHTVPYIGPYLEMGLKTLLKMGSY